MKPAAHLLAAITAATAQQIYVPTSGPAYRPQCSANNNSSYAATPVYSFQPFIFTQFETRRYATSIPSPTSTTTFAPPYASLSPLVPDLMTTQWGNWDPSVAASPTDAGIPYGNASWSALWTRVPAFVNLTRGVYSTTVLPTAVPMKELVLPPEDHYQPQTCLKFPEDFMLGVAASAVQIEGAVADEGRSPAYTDFKTRPEAADDFTANENYWLYKQDIERIAAMGVKYYRFSIPWTRILPFVVEGSPVNRQGLDHYDDLINFVLEKGMLPAVVLLHNDVPLHFHSNASNIVIRPGEGIGPVDAGYHLTYGNQTFEDAFVHYGKIIMTHFADRVPIWWTFNEPLLGSRNGKSIDAVVKAHARLYHFYREEIKGTGKVSITFNDNFGVPRNPEDPEDVAAANHFNEFQLATFGNPIFLGKDYPEGFKETIHDYVPLTASDLAYINGTADFFSIQPYTATVVSPPPNSSILACAQNTWHPLRPYCVTQNTTIHDTQWNIGYRSQTYVYLTPTYFRTYLNYLWNTFRSPVAVTEFGFPVFGEADKELQDQLFDTPRTHYYTAYLAEGLKAMWEDGVQWIGAFAWSFMDNWEFGDFDAQFGIQFVNRTTQERRYKKSFFDFVDFIESRRMH